MILFTLQKKELLRSLDQIKVHIKPSRRIHQVTKFIFLNNKLTIRIVGTEAILPCKHEGDGQFEMYLSDFYQAIIDPLIKRYEDITFIVSRKQIQINKRTLSILSSDFTASKSKKTLELPLGTLNFIEEGGLFKENRAKTFIIKNKGEGLITENTVLNDINMVNTILNKYGIDYYEIYALVHANLKEVRD